MGAYLKCKWYRIIVPPVQIGATWHLQLVLVNEVCNTASPDTTTP